MEVIQHQGIVKEVSGNILKVSLMVNSGCSSCQVKNACSLSEKKEKIVEVPASGLPYRPGDPVTVSFQQKKAAEAIMLAYVMPFLLAFAMLTLTWGATGNELLAGGLALAALLPWYTLLYFMRHKLKSRFSLNLGTEKMPI